MDGRVLILPEGAAVLELDAALQNVEKMSHPQLGAEVMPWNTI